MYILKMLMINNYINTLQDWFQIVHTFEKSNDQIMSINI